MVAEQPIVANESGPITLLEAESGASEAEYDRLACKVVALRIVEEDAGKINSLLVDSGARVGVGRQPMHAVRK